MSTIVTCRNCATMLRVSDNVSASDVCPQCFAPLDDSGAAPVDRAPNVLRDVRRDSNTTTVVLWLLVALCTVGVVWAYATINLNGTVGRGFDVGAIWSLLAAVGLLDVSILVATTWSLIHSMPRRGTPPSAGRIVGRVFGFIVLVLGMVFAVIIFLCASCFAMISRHL